MPWQRRVRPLMASLVLASSLLAPSFTRAFELEGEWYVLVHYEDHSDEIQSAGDDTGPEPDARFEDMAAELDRGVEYRDFVWRFEPVVDGVRWTIFSGLRFRDDTGRTERVHGMTARLHHAWRPSAGQLEEIRDGLEVDTKTARSKTLRRRGGKASGRTWASGAAPRARSASAVAYGERWEVRETAGGPVFALSAHLDSGRADGIDGVTTYRVDSLRPEAGRGEGAYDRDGTEIGRFMMWRKGAAHASDAEDAADSGADSLLGPGGGARSSVIALQALLDRAATPEGQEDAALRGEIRQGLTRLVEDAWVRRGGSLRADATRVAAMIDEVERLAVVEGLSLEEIDRRQRDVGFAP